MSVSVSAPHLIVQVGTRLCALPIECVAETMRPQPVRAVAGAPAPVRGLTVIRGVLVPVIDAAMTLGDDRPSPHVTRFVSLNTAERRVALAVDQVIGVRRIEPTQLADLPPLLSAANAEPIAAIGLLDGELLMVLRSGKLVPEEVWAAVEAARS